MVSYRARSASAPADLPVARLRRRFLRRVPCHAWSHRHGSHAGTASGRRRASGLPVFARHARQHRGRHHPGL